jgi:hypothetical protein
MLIRDDDDGGAGQDAPMRRERIYDGKKKSTLNPNNKVVSCSGEHFVPHSIRPQSQKYHTQLHQFLLYSFE